jgi:hypothetical protein
VEHAYSSAIQILLFRKNGDVSDVVAYNAAIPVSGSNRRMCSVSFEQSAWCLLKAKGEFSPAEWDQVGSFYKQVTLESIEEGAVSNRGTHPKSFDRFIITL